MAFDRCLIKDYLLITYLASYFGDSSSFNVIVADGPNKLVTSACYGKLYVCVYLQPFLR